MTQAEQAQAEEVVRTLAAAANAVRLYPRTSHLPGEAIERFVRTAEEATERGPLQLVVEPNGFSHGDAPLADGQVNVISLAEALYAHQTGRLIIAAGIAPGEVRAFLDRVAADPHETKAGGGLRESLKAAGVSRIAVIELTLRASTEGGLTGLDLTTAPVDEIAPRLAEAAFAWADSAAEGDGRDEVASAIGSLEEAARDLVARRLADALMRLDEPTRVRALQAALDTDAGGRPMRGMLEVVSRMSPAALARLLRLAAGTGGEVPDSVLGTLELPPEALRALSLMLEPSAQSETARGVPPEADVAALAADAAVEDDTETAELERTIARSSPALAAGRALATTVEIAVAKHTEDAVMAVGEALAPAVRTGAFAEVRKALSFLGGLAGDPALSAAVLRARTSLADTDLLRTCCAALFGGADADVVGAILSAAGPVGAETFIAFYLQADAATRTRLQPVLRSMGDVVTAAAGRGMRNADSRTAKELVEILAHMGDKRSLPILREAMEHLDADVRRASIAAIADAGGPESEALLARALGHWDPQTRRFAAREIGRVRAASAVPSMLRILQGYYLFERNYELKKEVIESLEALASPEPLPTLRRMANRRFVIGRKNRELQFLARRAVATLDGSR